MMASIRHNMASLQQHGDRLRLARGIDVVFLGAAGDSVKLGVQAVDGEATAALATAISPVGVEPRLDRHSAHFSFVRGVGRCLVLVGRPGETMRLGQFAELDVVKVTPVQTIVAWRKLAANEPSVSCLNNRSSRSSL